MAGEGLASAPWGSLATSGFFNELVQAVRADRRRTCVSGAVEGARALLLTLLVEQTGRRALLVLPDDTAVEAYRRDLSAFADLAGRDRKRIVVLPALDADPYAGIPAHPEVVRERIVALGRLRRRDLDFLLVPVRALLQPLPSPEELADWTRVVRKNATLPPEHFVIDCLSLGYRREDIVSAPGELSRRGGIIDIFPPSADEPVRIELFGDTVESLRAFDTDHQRSIGPLEQIEIGPAVENPPTDEALKRLSGYLQTELSGASGDRRMRRLRDLLEQLQEQGYWSGFEALAQLAARRPVSLLEHTEGMLICVDEPARTDDELIRASHDLQASHEQGSQRILPPPLRLFGDPRGIRERLADASVYVQELLGEEPEQAGELLRVACRSARAYSGRIPEAIEEIRRARERGDRVLCVMRAEGGAQRLMEIFTEYELEAARCGAASAEGLLVGVGGLRGGFEFPDHGWSVLTERDLFGEERKPVDRKKARRAVFISDFRDLKPGDFVVHTDHGVARYAGLGRPKGGSLNRDFMLLEFAGRDRLFVPTDRLDLVQKYSGVAGRRPAPDRLGGPGWERVKRRVRKSVESMARELLDLYARRQAASGRAFAPDTPWQNELEQAFPYELTVDQQRALGEIKADMEGPRPTDRLLVGDVGYGKTELAVRAAFKAVMDGVQVALLTPTTVLATQHYQTFRERFAPFPVRVELVSRFRTARDTRKVLEDLEVGSVDVLIGTHRLLSRDVRFKHLGLLVVDEEQRFGVTHKERLKQMSLGIDVVSMTATPIPRTLQMSLAGVRDLSVIETPPPGRTAIQTYVIPFRENVLANAIRQELRRGGQVFVVHDRVATLPWIVGKIAEMVPEARIVAAHGQMPDRKLESVMLQFYRHEADVLVTTTIIENGLDIPSANTIIVNRADHFGLAQLYQLRGRVGRSSEHAYAYFIVPGRAELGDEARKRLRALQEFSDLGAGFRLAAADLEIRGAGELLGARQHGHIASLGFDLYCQMLERAVADLQGEPLPERQPVSLHLGVDIKIPESYLAEAGDRLVIYKRLAQAAGADDVDRLQSETEDRFGHLPPPARSLFDMGRLRLLARQAGVTGIDLIENKLRIRFSGRPSVEPERILAVMAEQQGTLSPAGTVTLPAPDRGSDRIVAVTGLLGRMIGSA